eukprot:172186_1
MNMNNMNTMNMNHNGIPQMNQISNLHNLPQLNGHGNIMQQFGAVSGNNGNQSMLPTTSLLGGRGSYDSNDGDTMMQFLNNQSFTSSDAGMNGMLSVPNTSRSLNGLTSSNSQIPLEGGYMPRFSDNSLNLAQQPPIANITNISNIAVYNQ